MAIDLEVFGSATVSEEALSAMLTRRWGTRSVSLLSAHAAEFPYDVPSLTTAGRFAVTGTALVDDVQREFSYFVKHIREWSLSPEFAFVPVEIREWARTTVPWRTEAEVYSSDLAAELPPGLVMPDAMVQAIDDSSYAVWLEMVDVDQSEWDLERYAEAARLLGRFAASGAVRAVAETVSHDFRIQFYVEGRVRHDVLPVLRSDVWDHPTLTAEFGELRGPMLAAAERVDAIVAELSAMPHLAAHGDACPNNLLVRPDGTGFTLIDFGYFRLLPVGFDLGQLLIGDVQLGKRNADDLARRDAVIVEAYADGLADEGESIDIELLERAHALQLMLFSGLSAVPVELLDRDPDDGMRRLVAARARMAAHSLRLLETTATSE